MRIGRTLTGLATGVAVAALLSTLFAPTDALAKKRRRGGGALRVIDVNVGAFAGVKHNAVLEFKFTTEVDPATVSHAVLQVRAANATGTGFTREVPGSFQVRGNVVRFFPRLPTHLRNPDDPRGGFYSAGSARDNADENAGFQPATNYQIDLIGHPAPSAIRSVNGKRLNRSYRYNFTTAPITPRSDAFTIDTYGDAPPPGVRFTNPPDKVASALDQYAKHGGTQDVPADIAVTLFGLKVPLAPSTVRKDGAVTLTMLERHGDSEFRKPVKGTTFLEQNFDTAQLYFQPDLPLPDVGVFALRITKDVKDLTGRYDFRNNAERLRLRAIYEFLDTARRLSPDTPYEQLQDPEPSLISDWPASIAERAILKRNVLELGDTYPDEVDPRAMVIFSSRDEQISRGQLVLDFLKSDGYLDDSRSTASWDELVPSAAAAIMTIAGGSAVHGDYSPAVNETVNTDSFPNNTVQWRRLFIPPGVVVTITGSRPATLRALQVQIEGELRADGSVGDTGTTAGYDTTVVQKKGGKGGPGGGVGGDSSLSMPNGSSTTLGVGNPGIVGNDVFGELAAPEDGGRGGLGGGVAQSTAYNFGGGGGGGGARLAGTAGSAAAGPYASWSGAGGAGGAGSQNDDLEPLVGGAGGGSGGNGSYPYYTTWNKSAGGGGGGGGAIRVQTSGVFEIGAQGVVRSRGGNGGNGGGSSSTISAGPGGAGGGGSVLLQTSQKFSISSPAGCTDVRGGAGGSQTGSYVAPSGGSGGAGYVRLESPTGGLQIPGATTGFFDPVGAGVPSYVTSLWIDTGVDGPRFVNFTANDFDYVANNDAILIEMQCAVEDTSNFGSPKLDALNPDGTTQDPSEVSRWIPVRYIDNTGKGGTAIPNIPGYNPATQGSDYTFDVASQINGLNYKFVRFRVTFQLSDDQANGQALPYVDRVALTFEFNF